MNALFRRVQVVRWTSGQVIVYQCFEHLGGEGFCVQSADFIQGSKSLGEQFLQCEGRFLELLHEGSPFERCEFFQSLEEAIAAHDRIFEND